MCSWGAVLRAIMPREVKRGGSVQLCLSAQLFLMWEVGIEEGLAAVAPGKWKGGDKDDDSVRGHTQ
jgi:hypothetical protein